MQLIFGAILFETDRSLGDNFLFFSWKLGHFARQHKSVADYVASASAWKNHNFPHCNPNFFDFWHVWRCLHSSPHFEKTSGYCQTRGFWCWNPEKPAFSFFLPFSNILKSLSSNLSFPTSPFPENTKNVSKKWFKLALESRKRAKNRGNLNHQKKVIAQKQRINAFQSQNWMKSSRICRTALIRSALESPEPGALNGKLDVDFRPPGADLISFEIANSPSTDWVKKTQSYDALKINEFVSDHTTFYTRAALY